uniref:ABC transporter substrate-binding protein n=1 Tax=Hydrogenophaga sp. TaxID=1904254 RepID=UPI00356689A1
MTRTTSSSLPTTTDAARRRLLKAGVATAGLGLIGAPALVRAQGGPTIRVGYWPIAAGLPFYSAVELGYFKEAGLNVEVLRFAGAQQIMEAMLADRCDGSANGTGSANIAVGEIAAPGTFKIFCSNPSNAKN